MSPRSRYTALVVPALLAAVATAGLALAQDSSSSNHSSSERSSSDRSSSDRSSRSSRSDRESSRRSDRSSRSSSSSSSSATSQPTSFIDGYRLVLDRNIFSRNRVIYREPSSTPTTAPTGSYRSLPALSLTGVTLEGAAATAFIEDRRSNGTTFVHVGDAIADGKVTAINLDSIEYVSAAGHTVRVELGQAIEAGPTYSVSSSSSSSSSYTPSSSTSASPGTSAPSGDSNDILERLRQKRLQETKR